MKEIIVLQHINIEDPGYIKDLMIKDNINLTTIELDECEKIIIKPFCNFINHHNGTNSIAYISWRTKISSST